MRTPSYDIRLLRDPAELGGIIVPGPHTIQTSMHVAKRYRLDESRVHISPAVFDGGEEIGDCHLAASADARLVLEDFASFCSVLFAGDEQGNVAMLHSVLLAAPQHLCGSTMTYVRTYRRLVDAALRECGTVLMAAADAANIERVVAHVRETFADAERVLLQLSKNPLGQNALPATCADEGYRGMLYVPEQLSRTAQRVLLVLTNECHTVAMTDALRQ